MKKAKRLFKGKAKPDKNLKGPISKIKPRPVCKPDKWDEYYDRRPLSCCIECGAVIKCPACEAKYNPHYNRIDDALKLVAKRIHKRYLKPDSEKTIEGCILKKDVKFKVVGMDRRSMFTLQRDYELEYGVGNIIRGIPGSYGVSCFDTLEAVKEFLRNQISEWNFKGSIRDGEYKIILVKGIGVRHVSFCECNIINMKKFYKEYPPELGSSGYVFVGHREDDFDFKYVPDGTSWYDSVLVLT